MSRKRSRAELAKDYSEDDGLALPTFTVRPEDIEEDFIPALPPGPQGGRPSHYTLTTVATILNGIVHAMSYKGAANLADVSEDQFYEWRNSKPDFAKLVDKANAIFEAWIVDKVMRQVANNWAAGITLLERRDPERWGRRDRVEHTHTGSVGLNIQKVLSSPEAIQAASAYETAMQAGEVIDAEILRELPGHQEDEE
jgi:hypothetical protein